MAFNYGRRTPAITVVAHVVYGAILGGAYRLAGAFKMAKLAQRLVYYQL